MQIKDAKILPRAELEMLLDRVPFYRQVHQQEAWQFEQLLSATRLVELAPGEVIMRAGEKGHWLYFLVRGQLDVYAQAADDGQRLLNRITPGELFGDLALLTNSERRATVQAEPGGRSVQLVALDVTGFADDTARQFNTQTRILFYRQLVHSVRWRLESARMSHSGHPLFAELRKVPVYNGPRNGQDELQSLRTQARLLAELLVRWNAASGSAQDVFIGEAAPAGT